MRIPGLKAGRLTPFLATLVAIHPSAAQDTSTATPPPTAHTGRILGVFDEGGQPLEGVDVVDRIGGGTLRTTRTGLVGMGAFERQHDSAVVTIRKIGFADTTLLVMVGARDTVPVQVFLRHATVLEELMVTATPTEHLPFYLKDFEQRAGDTRFGARTFTADEFRKHDGSRLLDLLRTKGVGEGNGPCLVVYLDGVPWTPLEVESGSNGVPREDADKFDAAIYYSLSQMPADLMRAVTSATGMGGVPPCGALLLYSRHRT